MDHGVVVMVGAFTALLLWGVGSILVAAAVTRWTGCGE
jgi:hypothetical protein